MKKKKAGDDVLVQYIIMRRDLIDDLKWPVGALIAQGAHGIDAMFEQPASEEDVMSIRRIVLLVVNIYFLPDSLSCGD